MEGRRFVPVKRTAIDGKTWWVIYDTKKGQYSTFIYHGKYKRKKDAEWAINYYSEHYSKLA